MKVHYINILLFSLPLNIFLTLCHAHNKNKPSITHHTHTNRSLCECDLYMPSYDNDSQMKEIMENFNKQTQQRFHEYDDRMKEKRMQCKEQCDKEIQKIILKDKLEKELMDKFATLHTDIQSDAIPTCVCEKSLADKVEKGCLKCAQNLGGIVVPSSGVIGEISALAVKAWKTTEIAAATKEAIAEGAAAGKAAGEAAGVEAVISGLMDKFGLNTISGQSLNEIVTTQNFSNINLISQSVQMEYNAMCNSGTISNNSLFDLYNITFGDNKVQISKAIVGNTQTVVAKATEAAETTTADVTIKQTAALEVAKRSAIETTYMGYQTTIIAPLVAIVVIILIMVIIYLILRYRRKKKMKKKLQYIKLLKE
ncbi:rifin [Plasmodium reichenowi]|uniref:Rifin n=1 Tax=Plasmodium reichenowi TaxID=5854 RepID=A0A060RM21_PLARE|nr:rifin [Plasmodium reichenowi]